MDETSSKTVLIIPLSDYLERLTEEFTAEYPVYNKKSGEILPQVDIIKLESSCPKWRL